MTRVKAGAVHKNEARLGIGRFILKKMIKLPSHKFFGSVLPYLMFESKNAKRLEEVIVWGDPPLV